MENRGGDGAPGESSTPSEMSSLPKDLSSPQSAADADNGTTGETEKPDVTPTTTLERTSSATSSTLRQKRHSRGAVGKPGFIAGVGAAFSDEEANEAEKSDLQTGKWKRFSKRQWSLLVLFGMIDFFAAMSMSLQAPFYPAEAERKGATATEYGFVFGIFEFVIFLVSPFYGTYMNRLGPRAIFTTSIFVTSVAVFCFGLLDMVNDHTWFITLSFICRIFEALGAAGFFTATFVITGCEFPGAVGTTFASLETLIGLGLIVGPTVGGVLFEIGGFSFPFFVVGGFLLVTGMLSCIAMPKIENATRDGTEDVGYGIWTILKIPTVIICALSVASTSLSFGFVTATLEPHIRQFGLTPLQTGLVFIVNAGVYCVLAPICGYLCDNVSRPVYIGIVGNFLISLAFVFIGPADFMPFDTILWVTIVGLVIQGFGFGCCFVSSFFISLKESINYGLPENVSTYAVVAGLWQSMVSLGAWVGPSTGGFLFDIVGFREGSWFPMILTLTVGIISLVQACCTRASSKSECQPLLVQQPISPSSEGETKFEEKPQHAALYGSTTS